MSDTCSMNTHNLAHLASISLSILDKHILERELKANSLLWEVNKLIVGCSCGTLNSSNAEITRIKKMPI